MKEEIGAILKGLNERNKNFNDMVKSGEIGLDEFAEIILVMYKTRNRIP